MLNQLLPPTIDNAYRGHKVGLWLFVLLVSMKVAMGVNSLFNGAAILVAADGIPLHTYPPAAARTIVSLFAIWALAQLTLCAIGVLAAARYRGMVPFLFALFLVEHLGRRLVLHLMPLARTGAPPASAINSLLLALMVVGLTLSLLRQGIREEPGHRPSS